MRAAAGIEHSEMPHGDAPCRFVQLWRNLPRARKMEPAAYADLRAEDIPTRDAGASAARVIAGASGGVRAPPQPRARPPGEQDDDDDDDATVLDIAMEPGARFATELRAGDAGRPLDEPVVAHGPFVMCSPEEIRAAFSDYQRGLF